MQGAGYVFAVGLLLAFSAPCVAAGELGFLRNCINGKLSSESDALQDN